MTSAPVLLGVAQDLYSQMRSTIKVLSGQIEPRAEASLNSEFLEDWELDVKLRLLWLMHADNHLAQEEVDLLNGLLGSDRSLIQWQDLIKKYAGALPAVCSRSPQWATVVAGLDQKRRTENLNTLVLLLSSLLRVAAVIDSERSAVEVERHQQLLKPFFAVAERHGLFLNRVELLDDMAVKKEISDPLNVNQEVLAELESLIGLESIKAEARSLIALAQVNQMRRQHGLPVLPMSLHLVFSGNPGTGKTTVARLLSRVYAGIGLLSKGHLVEVDRSALVAGYVGQTAIKVREVVDKAKGGVLFLDEAYSLVQSPEDTFGNEALDALLKYMEDLRSDLVVIVAGYREPMEEFLASNPGLKSRFNRFLEFHDYSADELLQILLLNFQRSGFLLADQVVGILKDNVQVMFDHRPARFGNGRAMRNYFEDIVQAQANRLIERGKPIAARDLMTIEILDIKKATIRD